MHEHVASAVFRSNAAAASAVSELRTMGVSDGAISVLTQRRDCEDDSDAESGALRGLLGGALGAGLGVVALAIPGVGPLAATGAIAAAAVPAVASLGAAAGGLAGLLSSYGVSRDAAAGHERELRTGGVLLLVDTRGINVLVADAQAALDRHGGRGRAVAAEPDNRR